MSPRFFVHRKCKCCVCKFIVNEGDWNWRLGLIGALALPRGTTAGGGGAWRGAALKGWTPLDVNDVGSAAFLIYERA